MQNLSFTLNLPDWIPAFLADCSNPCPDVESRMRLAINLAARNVEAGTGGPFGAAVFHEDTGQLIAVGVNRVLATNCSLAHAEIIALSLAQQRLGTWDLAAVHRSQLVTSTEPCAMCLGAIPWSGVSSVVTAARDEDARALGFDEGAKPHEWAHTLTARGIAVVRDVLRQDACQVLHAYQKGQGYIYNSSNHPKKRP